MPIQIKSTTTSTTTTSTKAPSRSSTPQLEIFTVSKNKNEHNGPTSTFDDLLNSFQKESTSTTTRRPQLTTFSDADDIAFLKGLVRIKSILVTMFSVFLLLLLFVCLFTLPFTNYINCLHSLFLSNWIRAFSSIPNSHCMSPQYKNQHAKGETFSIVFFLLLSFSASNCG